MKFTNRYAARPSRIACALVAAAVLSACGSDDSDGPGTGASAAPESSPTISAMTGDPVRDAVISAMSTENPSIAEMAADENYTLEQIPVAALPEWDVINLTLDHPSGPQGTTIAVAENGRGVVLLGSPENFAEIAKGAQVESAEQAVELVQVYLKTTGDQSQPSYPVSSVDDIKFIPRPDADQSAQIDGLRKDRGPAIAGPVASSSGKSWTVVAWWVTEQQLIKHEVVVDAESGLTDSPTVVADQMPTPVSP